MIDATGKPGSNIEGGNIVWIGSLSECLDIRAVNNTTGKYLFKGQYSIVVFVPPGPVRQVRNNTARWFSMKPPSSIFVLYQGMFVQYGCDGDLFMTTNRFTAVVTIAQREQLHKSYTSNLLRLKSRSRNQTV